MYEQDTSAVYVISIDGTMMPLSNCTVIELTFEEAMRLLDDYSDSERYQIARELLNTKEHHHGPEAEWT